MQTAILESESKSNLKLLLDLAKRLGIKSKVLSVDEIEEIGLAQAIKIGRTGEYVDTDEFVKKLSKWLFWLINDKSSPIGGLFFGNKITIREKCCMFEVELKKEWHPF